MFNLSQPKSCNPLSPHAALPPHLADVVEGNSQTISDSAKEVKQADQATAISGFKITPLKFISAMKKVCENVSEEEMHCLFPEDKNLAESWI